jgi:pimeloyl-ACP methyl ester carboxylesterase
VVWGEHDGIVPLSAGRRYAEIVSGARLEIVNDAGHHIELERPAELARLILDFAG